MTWSIVARDPKTGKFGVAVTTKFFAVGALCPRAIGGIGALATQALVNPTYGPRGLRLLAEGVPASKVVELLIASDEGRDFRQIHVIDMQGRNAVHTGKSCVAWCGHLVRDGYSVAGNMLAGPKVIEDTAIAYAANAAESFAERLIRALEAGQAAGGDKRGKQAACLIIYATEEYPELDLRVDDHAEPLVELRRLYDVSHERYAVFVRHLATRANPCGTYDRGVIEADIVRANAAD